MRMSSLSEMGDKCNSHGRSKQVRLSGPGNAAATALIMVIAADGRCYMTLRGTGAADYSTWLTIWAKGVTIANMCAAQGKKGLWTALGTLRFVILATTITLTIALLIRK